MVNHPWKFYVWYIQVALSDGDLSTLMNMKLNLESNNFSIETNRQERTEDSNSVSDGHNESNTLSYWSHRNLFKSVVAEKPETHYKSQIKCIHLPWESASENELQDFMPDVMWVFMCFLWLIGLFELFAHRTIYQYPCQIDDKFDQMIMPTFDSMVGDQVAKHCDLICSIVSLFDA